MNDFINKINVEGVDYDIQTSVRPPLKYLESDNSLDLQLGTGLYITSGLLECKVNHNFYDQGMIWISSRDWAIDNEDCLLPPRTSSILIVDTQHDFTTETSALTLGSGIMCIGDKVVFSGMNIGTESNINTISFGTAFNTEVVSTDEYGRRHLNVDINPEFLNSVSGGGIGIWNDDLTLFISSLFIDSSGLELIQEGDVSAMLRINISSESGLKADSEGLAIYLGTRAKGLEISSNEDLQVSLGSGLAFSNTVEGEEWGDIRVYYDENYLAFDDEGRLTLSDAVKEKLGL